MEPFFITHPVLFIGMVLFSGYALSLIFKKYSVPHVLIYLIVGFVIVNVFFPHIDFETEYNDIFSAIEVIALGLIGFKIGTELKIDLIKDHPKFLSVVLLFEAGGAFIFVTALTYFVLQDFMIAILLGGLATPTAPAVTIEIMHRLGAKGVLTTRLNWVLAFDDLVGITIIEGTLVFLQLKFTGTLKIFDFIIGIFHEIGYAIILGLIIGVLLDYPLERLKNDLSMMELTLGTLILGMGIAAYIETSVIMTTMVIGATVTNHGGDNYKNAQDLLETLMSPVMIIFFVIVGSKLLIGDLLQFPLLVIIYLIGRSFGKIFGAFAGSSITKEDKCIRENIGFGLLAQGGVALGLATVINEQLLAQGLSDAGHIISSTILITTFFSEVFGALGTTFALKRAGEVTVDS